MRRDFSHRSVRLGDGLAESLDQASRSLGVTVGEVLRRGLSRYLLEVQLQNFLGGLWDERSDRGTEVERQWW